MCMQQSTRHRKSQANWLLSWEGLCCNHEKCWNMKNVSDEEDRQVAVDDIMKTNHTR